MKKRIPVNFYEEVSFDLAPRKPQEDKPQDNRHEEAQNHPPQPPPPRHAPHRPDGHPYLDPAIPMPLPPPKDLPPVEENNLLTG